METLLLAEHLVELLEVAWSSGAKAPEPLCQLGALVIRIIAKLTSSRCSRQHWQCCPGGRAPVLPSIPGHHIRDSSPVLSTPWAQESRSASGEVWWLEKAIHRAVDSGRRASLIYRKEVRQPPRKRHSVACRSSDLLNRDPAIVNDAAYGFRVVTGVDAYQFAAACPRMRRVLSAPKMC